MRFLLTALFCFAVPALGAAAPSYAAPVRSPDSLSFAELYRMTVQGVSAVELAPEAQIAMPLPEYQVRVASLEPKAPAAAAAPSYSFSAPLLPDPSSRWLLVLSGLAL